jgi:predicted metal-binding protein
MHFHMYPEDESHFQDPDATIHSFITCCGCKDFLVVFWVVASLEFTTSIMTICNV